MPEGSTDLKSQDYVSQEQTRKTKHTNCVFFFFQSDYVTREWRRENESKTIAVMADYDNKLERSERFN